MYNLKGFLSQLVKAVCLSEIGTEDPFPSTESQGSPPPTLSLLAMFGKPGTLVRPGSGLLSQWLRHVSLLLPALVYYLPYLTLFLSLDCYL